MWLLYLREAVSRLLVSVVPTAAASSYKEVLACGLEAITVQQLFSQGEIYIVITHESAIRRYMWIAG